MKKLRYSPAAGRRTQILILLSSEPGVCGFPIPVIKTFFARLKKVNTRALDQESSLLGSDASDGLVQFSCFEIEMCTH